MEKYLVLFACYLIGAIPFGYVTCKLIRGIDIREHGSGNIGATNVIRTLGIGPGALVMAFDISKGLGAVLLCNALGFSPVWVVFGALLSVFGHAFSVFLKFKGGKGVATSLGIVIGLNWEIAAIAFCIWAVAILITRYVSVGSILAAIAVPLMMIFWKSQNIPVEYQILAVVAAIGIVLKHNSNIKRLINGNELKIGRK